MWYHNADPLLSPLSCTWSLPAASCVLVGGASSWGTSPSDNWEPVETQMMKKMVNLCFLWVKQAKFPDRLWYESTSGWELCGSRAIRGLSEEPGKRYSGGGPSWLADSPFELLNERFRLFPFGRLESVVGEGERFQNESETILWLFVALLFQWAVSLCIYQVCVWVSLVRLVIVLLWVHREVRTLSAAPQPEPSGLWRSGRYKVLQRQALVSIQCCLTVFMKVTVMWEKSAEPVKWTTLLTKHPEHSGEQMVGIV